MMQNTWKPILLISAVLSTTGCVMTPVRDMSVAEGINKEMREAAKPVAQGTSKAEDTLSDAGAPSTPLSSLPSMVLIGSKAKAEKHFDIAVNEAPVTQVMSGIVSGTKYSLMVHPDVKGAITVNLKNVTVLEALNAIREVYGYEYKLDGNRIYIEPAGVQTRIFQVNYINSRRVGASDMNVISGSISGGQSGSSQTSTSSASGNQSGRQNSVSSSIQTSSSSDFWNDLTTTLNSMIGSDGGRKVVVNQQSGLIMVRAMPSEIRNTEKFLKMMQLNVERQVILEAKIIEVQLNNGSQAGINWSVFGGSGASNFTVGNVGSGATLEKGGSGNLVADGLSVGAGAIANAATGSMFAAAIQAANFSALINFLDTQGTVHVLSSPRIATINNQKAVLKVGTDEFFVTGVSTTTTASTGATTTAPEVTLNPFFSGISLDVTPQIDEDDNITLHVHPSISDVSTVTKQVSVGSGQMISLPLASSRVSETDSVVRARDGQVVAIGGLMKQGAVGTSSGVPGLSDVKGLGALFKRSNTSSTKSELVILMKPTIIRSGSNWGDDVMAASSRIDNIDRANGLETQ